MDASTQRNSIRRRAVAANPHLLEAVADPYLAPFDGIRRAERGSRKHDGPKAGDLRFYRRGANETPAARTPVSVKNERREERA